MIRTIVYWGLYWEIQSLDKSFIQQFVLAGARRLPQALSVNAAWLFCSRLWSQPHELRYVMGDYIGESYRGY